MTTPENGRAASPEEIDGERFLQDLDAALEGHEPDGSHADTARFAAQLAGVLQSQASSAPENLKQKIGDTTAKPAVKNKPSTVVRMDRALKRYRLGVLDLAAIVALTVLGILIWRSLETPPVAKPEIKTAEPEKRLAAEDVKPPAPDKAPPKVPLEEPWEKEVRAKLERKVSFEFVDTPLEEVLGFLKSLTTVNIILDPKAAAEGVHKTPVTLRVRDMSLGVALQWILRGCKLEMALRNECIYISNRITLPVEMRVLDVSGLPVSPELLSDLIKQRFKMGGTEVSDVSIRPMGNLLNIAQTRDAFREIFAMIAAIREQAPSGKINFQPSVQPEWKKALLEKLKKKKVTFEFVDTQFEEVIAFIQQLSDVNVVVDPKLIAAGPPPLNLRVTDMDMNLALEWILRLADYSYSIENEAIYITKSNTVRPTIVGYDISAILKSRGMTADALRSVVMSTVSPNSWVEPDTSIHTNNNDTWMFVQHDESVQLQVESLLQKIANPEKP